MKFYNKITKLGPMMSYKMAYQFHCNNLPKSKGDKALVTEKTGQLNVNVGNILQVIKVLENEMRRVCFVQEIGSL